MDRGKKDEIADAFVMPALKIRGFGLGWISIATFRLALEPKE